MCFNDQRRTFYESTTLTSRSNYKLRVYKLICQNAYHLNTRLSHSDIAATQSTAIPVRLLIKYVRGKTSKKAALGSPIWVTISHSFWWFIVLCCRLSANQMPWVYTDSILFCPGVTHYEANKMEFRLVMNFRSTAGIRTVLRLSARWRALATHCEGGWKRHCPKTCARIFLKIIIIILII